MQGAQLPPLLRCSLRPPAERKDIHESATCCPRSLFCRHLNSSFAHRSMMARACGLGRTAANQECCFIEAPRPAAGAAARARTDHHWQRFPPDRWGRCWESEFCHAQQRRRDAASDSRPPLPAAHLMGNGNFNGTPRRILPLAAPCIILWERFALVCGQASWFARVRLFVLCWVDVLGLGNLYQWGQCMYY